MSGNPEVPNIEHDGDVVVDPSAMLPPSRDVPQAGQERINQEQLASMHEEFTPQGRQAAAERAAQDATSPTRNITKTKVSIDGVDHYVYRNTKTEAERTIRAAEADSKTEFGILSELSDE